MLFQRPIVHIHSKNTMCLETTGNMSRTGDVSKQSGTHSNTHDIELSTDSAFIMHFFQIAMPTNIHVHVSATSYFLALLCVYLQCKKLIHGGISVLLGMDMLYVFNMITLGFSL